MDINTIFRKHFFISSKEPDYIYEFPSPKLFIDLTKLFGKRGESKLA